MSEWHELDRRILMPGLATDPRGPKPASTSFAELITKLQNEYMTEEQVPKEARTASSWTEAQLRMWFETGGSNDGCEAIAIARGATALPALNGRLLRAAAPVGIVYLHCNPRSFGAPYMTYFLQSKLF